jgi:hypothetical protein
MLTALHFPFHLALVLLVEGVNQIFVWSHITADLDTQLGKLDNIPENATDAQTYQIINDTINYVFAHFPSTDDTYYETQDALATLESNSTNITIQEVASAVVQIYQNIAEVIFDGFDWEVPDTADVEVDLSGDGNIYDAMSAELAAFGQKYLNIFSISFGKC